jgi:alkylhydroperoxidase/carboxymuconolactone decarboxylase family protein YurZ
MADRESRPPWEQHYLDVMGFVPPGIKTIFAVDKDFGQIFVDLRELMFRERPDGLPQAIKELLLVVLDIAANNQHGALNHLKSARRAGLTRTQYCEALMAIYLILGVSGLAHGGTEGLRAWDAEKADERGADD